MTDGLPRLVTPPVGDGGPDPAAALTAAQFVALMRALRAWSGLSYRELERRASAAGDVLPRATLAGALSRQELPREEVLTAFVRACGAGADEVIAWRQTRRRLAAEASAGAGETEPRLPPVESTSPAAVKPVRPDPLPSPTATPGPDTLPSPEALPGPGTDRAGGPGAVPDKVSASPRVPAPLEAASGLDTAKKPLIVRQTAPNSGRRERTAAAQPPGTSIPAAAPGRTAPATARVTRTSGPPRRAGSDLLAAWRRAPLVTVLAALLVVVAATVLGTQMLRDRDRPSPSTPSHAPLPSQSPPPTPASATTSAAAGGGPGPSTSTPGATSGARTTGSAPVQAVPNTPARSRPATAGATTPAPRTPAQPSAEAGLPWTPPPAQSRPTTLPPNDPNFTPTSYYTEDPCWNEAPGCADGLHT
ncbi:helix-turn-helix domain-containing protein [Kitasatospora herbaricolor]|uniref:helix-turn-helix domain-containing protein n=1 Tax=Kitasatospora herbaricolor TaxID=68217 RepID=UPI0039A55442